VSAADVTAQQFAVARWVFATFSALAVAFAGGIAALVYYARSRVPGALSFLGQLAAKVARARRAYYGRLRKPLKVEVPGPERVVYPDGKEPPVVIEKPVDRMIDHYTDHIVLIPRWGIKNPIHINPLVEAGKRGSGGDAENDNPTARKVSN
jgi:hypothetical protein